MMKFPSEPKRKRAQLPSSAYDPRYKDVFLRGRREAFSLEFASANEVIKFRQRAQQYRAAVNREGDRDLAKLLYQVTLRIDSTNSRKLFIEPSDAQFEGAFQAVGGSPGGVHDTPSQTPHLERQDETPPGGDPQPETITLADLMRDIDNL